MSMKIALLAIDMQRDFVLDGAPLSVPGGEADDKRAGELIDRIGEKLTSIICTLDQHQKFHIAHAQYWVDKDGNHPKPFDVISHDSVADGFWRTKHMGLQEWGLKYTKQLDDGGRFPLVIWPEHCLIGRHGACLSPKIEEAISRWETKPAVVRYVAKGSCPHTEHYGAVKAEVPYKDDPTTQMNTPFVRLMEEPDLILFLGEADTHCVPTTMLDTADELSDEHMKKIVFLEDCASSVPGFEKQRDDAFNKLIARGMRVDRSDKILL